MSLYPHQNVFLNWCTNVQSLHDTSVQMINNVIISFWKYYSNNSIDEPNPNNVLPSDVNAYLAQLEQKENLKIRTINKYISYIKKYFVFLADHKYIDSYTLFTLQGRKFNRQALVIIDWMDNISNFLGQDFHPETIKLLTLISLGFDIDELLKVHWLAIKNKIDNTLVKDYIVEHLDFKKMQDPFVLQSQNGTGLKSLETIMHKVRLDQDKTKLPLIPVKLRQSYILSKIADSSKSNKELMKNLGISFKTLIYYQTCIKENKIIRYSEL